MPVPKGGLVVGRRTEDVFSPMELEVGGDFGRSYESRPRRDENVEVIQKIACDEEGRGLVEETPIGMPGQHCHRPSGAE